MRQPSTPAWIARAAVLALTCALASTARADDGEQEAVLASGEAVGSGDAVRTRALDTAFATAVTQVARGMLSAEARRQSDATLRDQIYRRARLYVAKYQVVDERSVEGTLRVQVMVTVDRDKLRQAFVANGIDTDPVAAPPAAGGGNRPKLVILLKATTGERTETTFGTTGGDGGAVGRKVAADLRGQGFDVVSAAGVQAPVEQGESAEGLLGDDAALELARTAGAGAALIVGVRADPEGRVRGTAFAGATATAAVRLIDVRVGKAVAKGSAPGGGYAESADGALAAAAAQAIDRASAEVGLALTRHWPPARIATGHKPVKIRGATTWAAIAGIIDRLAATRGVKAVHPARVDRGRVDLAIDSSLSPAEIAAQIKKARLPSGSLATTVKGGEVLVKVSGDSRYAPGGR